MKKINLNFLLLLLGSVGWIPIGTAQNAIVPVPTYNNQEEMPITRITPQQKALRQLPMPILNENGFELTLFENELNECLAKHPEILNQIDQSNKDLIAQKQFYELTQILFEMGHFKRTTLNSKKGGNHE